MRRSAGLCNAGHADSAGHGTDCASSTSVGQNAPSCRIGLHNTAERFACSAPRQADTSPSGLSLAELLGFRARIVVGRRVAVLICRRTDYLCVLACHLTCREEAHSVLELLQRAVASPSVCVCVSKAYPLLPFGSSDASPAIMSKRPQVSAQVPAVRGTHRAVLSLVRGFGCASTLHVFLSSVSSWTSCSSTA